jgi:DNA-binding transcriptional ArsR family regulator
MPRTSATSDVFSALAEPRRRQIIVLLSQRPGLAVGAIVLALGIRQPDVSKHLSVLRQLGIVSVSKLGQQRVYDLNPDPLRPVCDWVKALERHWEHQLDRIRARAERRALDRSNAQDQTNRTKGTT